MGEFLDKLTILEIKSERIKDPRKLANIEKELTALWRNWVSSGYSTAGVEEELKVLKSINERLWEIEDAIRKKELHRQFDQEFIELVRAVYRTNDRRAGVKRGLSERLGSALLEEKSYPDHGSKD